MSLGPTFVPPLDDAATLVVWLGYVNVNCSVTGTTITIDLSDGGTLAGIGGFSGFDVASTPVTSSTAMIQVSGMQAGSSPAIWESYWSRVTFVTSPTEATLADAPPSFALVGAQCTLYLPLFFGDPNYYVVDGSLEFSSALSTAPTFNFDLFTQPYGTPGTLFLPQVGQPCMLTDFALPGGGVLHAILSAAGTDYAPGDVFYVYQPGVVFAYVIQVDTVDGMGGILTWHSTATGIGYSPGLCPLTLNVIGSGGGAQITIISTTGGTVFGGHTGDIFGGSIEQIEISNIPGTQAYLCKCECVSWNTILPRRVLGISPAFPSSDDVILLNGGDETNGVPSGSTFGAVNYFDLHTSPLTMASPLLVNGSPQTIGPLSAFPPNGGTGGYDWYWSLGSSLLYQAIGSTKLNSGDHVSITTTSASPTGGSLVFNNQTADQIILALLNYIGGSECIYVANMVTGPNVNAITFKADSTVDDAMSSVLSYVNDGTKTFWYYIDPRKGFHFEIQGATKPAPWNISEADLSDANVLVQVSNAITREKFANSAYLSFNTLLPVITERIVADGSSRTFTLSQPCGSTPTILFYPSTSGTPPLICPAPGTPVPGGNHVQTQNVGVQGQTGYDFYWSPGSSSIEEDAGSVLLQKTMAIYVTYRPQATISQPYIDNALTDPGSVPNRQKIEGGSGEYDVTMDVTSSLPFVQGVPGQSSAANVAQTIAQYFSYMSQTVAIKTHRSGLAPGQSIDIDLGAVALGTLATQNPFVVQSVSLTTENRLKVWDVTVISGALVGDWKTAIKYMTGGGSSSSAVGAGGSTQTETEPFTFIFGVGSNGQPADLILDSVTNLLIANQPGTFTGWMAVLATAATGAAVIFDVLLNGVSIFSTPPTIPASNTAVQQGTGFSTMTFNLGDTLQGKVTQIGSTLSGQAATLELNWS